MASAKDDVSDKQAHDLACDIVDEQREKLDACRPELVNIAYMGTAEVWFVWGIFVALTDDDKRRKTLLSNYLSQRLGLDADFSTKYAHEVASTATENNALFDAIAFQGGQACREGGDDYFVEIAKVLIKILRSQ